MNAPSKVTKADSLAASMAAAFAEIDKATASAENSHFKSKYADLGAVIAAIKPALIAHGLFVTQHPHPTDRGVTVETVLHHAGGESMSLGSLFVPANKQDAHGYGSALTYARRYGFVTAFAVPVEDDDGNAAVKAGAEPDKEERDCPISDNDRDLIQTLAPGAGKTTQAICEAYGVDNLTQLTGTQGKAIITRLQSLAKEPANA